MDLASLPYVLIIFAAFIGVILTIYIYHKKRSHETLVCPLKGHCETVINSKFSRFLGIPVELLGLFYYSAISLAYGIFLVVPLTATPLLTVAAFVASCLAFLFSAYLVFIQIFYIRQLCTWCLFSASLCTVIFGLSVFVSGGTALLFIAPYMGAVVSIYTLALALGVGGVTFTAIFLGKFLKDLHVSSVEAELMHLVSQVIWLALAALFMTGTIAYISVGQVASVAIFSPIQIMAVLVTIGAAAILDLLVTPRLIQISLRQDHMHQMGELHFLRRLALGLSGILLVSWYTSFILGTVPGLATYSLVIPVYFGLLIVGLLISQGIERFLGTPLKLTT